MLSIAKHWKSVSVLLPCAEVCVATVVGVTQVGQRQGEYFLHLQQQETKEVLVPILFPSGSF